MRVCLINPPDEHSLDPMLDAPLGLMYISSYLNSHEINAEVLDLSYYTKSDWDYLIRCKMADVYGITINSASLPRAIQLAKSIKDFYPKAKVVAGGPHPTAKPVDTFKTEAFDFIVIGEGEYAMLQICKGRALRRIIPSTPLPVNSFPFPDRTSVPIHGYTRTVDGKKSCSMITSRGCPYKCIFCSSQLMWKRVSFRSAESVLKEIKHIKNIGFDAVHFWDDTFTLKLSRLVKILDGIKDLGMVFRCNGNLRTDTPEIHKKLYDSGCREYCIGVESGSQKILDIIGKGTTVERNKMVIKSAMDAGLVVKAYLMVGSPGEDWETVEETKKFMNDVRPHQWTLFNFVPMPGCDVYENPAKYKIKRDKINWEEYYCIGGKNTGGLTHETESLTKENIARARMYLLDSLPKQKGNLQNYYKEVKK